MRCEIMWREMDEQFRHLKDKSGDYVERPMLVIRLLIALDNDDDDDKKGYKYGRRYDEKSY